MDVSDGFGGVSQLAGQFSQAAGDLQVMGGFAFVEDGKPFGVLRDLQQRGSERVPGITPRRAHNLPYCQG